MTGQSLALEAYQQLRRTIIRCEFPPGGQITESGIAEQFEFGRAAIRTALNWLSRDGLVAPIPRQGHIVTPITMRHVREMFEIRSLLEPPSMAKAATIGLDTAHLNDLDKLCRDAAYEPGDRDGIDRFLQANTEFHVALVAAVGNDRLTSMMRDILEQMERLFHFSLLIIDRNTEMYHEHHELIEALND